MFGLCADEGLIFSARFYQNSKRWELVRRNWESWASLLFFSRERDLTTERDRQAASDIGRFYYGEDTQISSLPSDEHTLSKLTRMFSMSNFYSGVDQDARLLADAGVAVHTFILTHPPSFSAMDIFRLNLKQLIYMFSARAFGYNPYPQHYGVSHCDDLSYLFPLGLPKSLQKEITEDQKLVQKYMIDIVSTFAATGDPSLVEELGKIWEPLQVIFDQYNILFISLWLLSIIG